MPWRGAGGRGQAAGGRGQGAGGGAVQGAGVLTKFLYGED